MGGNSWPLWGPDPAIMFRGSTQLGAGSLEKMSVWNRRVEIDSVRAYYYVCMCVHARVVWHACGGAHMCICTCGACVFSVLCSMYISTYISVCAVYVGIVCVCGVHSRAHLLCCMGVFVCVLGIVMHTLVCVYVGFACMCWAYSWTHLCVCICRVCMCVLGVLVCTPRL